MAEPLRYEGFSCFRQRLVLSTLSGRPVRISNIRQLDDNPGLVEYEACLLRLMDKATNGTRIEINVSGTTVLYRPGVIYGGKFTHDCGNARAIGYYLEALLMIAPFAKKPFQVTFTGITNDQKDVSVDVIRTVTLPFLKQFGIEEGVELKIIKRGAAPDGGGEILFTCPAVKTLKPINLMSFGKVKRVRGIAYSMRVSPQTGPRIVDAARVVLNKFIPDVYIYNDNFKGSESGKSPGWGISLVAETTTGLAVSAEASAAKGDLPEDIGNAVVKLLLEEISQGGCVDAAHQSIAILFMTLGPEDVSQIKLGKLTPYTIHFLRHIRDYFGTVFKIRTDDETGTVTLACQGIGYTNLSRKVQ